MVREPISIAAATPHDVPAILGFIRKLAEYEHLSHLVVATEQALHEHLFGADRAAEVLIGRLGDKPVGFALFFRTFSTFLGRPGIWLEDLFVLPDRNMDPGSPGMFQYIVQLLLYDAEDGHFQIGRASCRERV